MGNNSTIVTSSVMLLCILYLIIAEKYFRDNGKIFAEAAAATDGVAAGEGKDGVKSSFRLGG